MGISPISNLMPLAVDSVSRADRDSLPMQRVENSARSGDETYSPGGERSAGGSEGDPDGNAVPDDGSGEISGEPIAQQAEQSGDTLPLGGINLFA